MARRNVVAIVAVVIVVSVTTIVVAGLIADRSRGPSVDHHHDLVHHLHNHDNDDDNDHHHNHNRST